MSRGDEITKAAHGRTAESRNPDDDPAKIVRTAIRDNLDELRD